MRLRTKLISGFMGAVALAVVLGGVAWYGMNYMGSRADEAVAVDKAAMDLLLAKISQLRFLYYGDAKEIDLTRQYGQASEKKYAALVAKAGNSRDALKLQAILSNLRQYNERFDALVAQSDALTASDNNLLDLTTGMDETFTSLQTALRTAPDLQTNTGQFALLSRLNQARTSFNLSRIAMLTYRSTPTEAHAATARQAIAAAGTALEQTVALATPAQRATLDKLQKQFAAYAATFEANIRQRTDMRAAISVIHQLVLTTVDMAGQATDQAVSTLTNARRDSLLGVAGLTLLALVLGMLLSGLLTRSVLAQLGKDPGDLAAVARRVSSGDFTLDDDAGDRGVYADLKAMVRALRENIEKARQESERARAESDKAHEALEQADAARREAVQAKRQGMLDAAGRLEKIVGVVASAAERLAAQMAEAERGAREQAERITDTATAMEEMNSTMVEVARNAAYASEVSDRMRGKAVDGSHLMEAAVSGMAKVRGQSADVRTSMQELTGHVQAINRIMNIISDIADQTNLLALNAAIEAARAGDAGRGFAVVADEVRKLAEKTIASTTDVAGVISGINHSAQKNMTVVDGTVQEVEGTTSLVDQSGVMLQEIAALVEDSADQSRLIATASEQQSSAAQEISQSVTEVNGIAVSMAQAMQEGSRTVKDLAVQARELSALIAILKNED